MKAYIIPFCVLALAGALSFAEDKPPGPPPEGGGRGPGKPSRPNPEEVFKKLDANSDGSVSLDEFKAGPGPGGQRDAAKAEEIFKKIDADGSGSVSVEEFKAHRPGRPGGPGHGPGENGGKRPGKPGGKGAGGEHPPKDA